VKKLLRPFYKNGRYFNDKSQHTESFLFGTIPSLVQSLIGRAQRLPTQRYPWIHYCEPRRASLVPIITWIGHSTFLIQLGGINVLLDPIFGDLSYFHKRVFPPGITLAQLPPIDCVLISHNHRDHMDEKSLLGLKRHPELRILVPKGDKKWFEKRNFEQVTEFEWWQKKSFFSIGNYFCGNISFTFLPAIHWSQRTLFDKNRSLWGSWMIEWESTYFYFAGDTAYSSHFAQIGQEFPRIDVALMPIGPCEPRLWMRKMHVDAKEAIQGFLDLGARHFIPMHWGTFLMGMDEYDRPLRVLRQEWVKRIGKESTKQTLHVLSIGQQIELVKTLEEPALQITFGAQKERHF